LRQPRADRRERAAPGGRGADRQVPAGLLPQPLVTSAARAEGVPDGVSIGAVLRELQTDFPDLTISKIRYLETEGLISPERKASGYRLFAPADVARLRFILTAQRDRFWPLKVIKDALDRLDQGLDVPGLTDGATGRDGPRGRPGADADGAPPVGTDPGDERPG